MPLRDHFRPPLDDKRSWDELHGMWPAMIVRSLADVLPSGYFAAPGVHLGTLYEIDVSTYADDDALEAASALSSSGGAAVCTPAKPTLTFEPCLPEQDVYEVCVYDGRRGRRLVAEIELVSPSNKDRPESRGAFVSKVVSLLRQDVCVSIVDVVTTRPRNLFAELLTLVEADDAALGDPPVPNYAVTIRNRPEKRRPLFETWFYPLAIGQPLPELPIWLTAELPVTLELEASYEETCRWLRIL